MVEKSTGHEKKGVSQLWLVENATLDRWVFTLGEENNGGELFLMDDKMTWPPPWRHFLELGFSGEEEFLVRPQEAGEAQLNKKYFIAFNSSPAHPPFASYNHVLAKHSWPTGGLLHRSVNRPLVSGHQRSYMFIVTNSKGF